jgi:hypothetical protein
MMIGLAGFAVVCSLVLEMMFVGMIKTVLKKDEKEVFENKVMNPFLALKWLHG